MLTSDAIKIEAKKRRKPAGVIEKDYALEWLLKGIYHEKSPLKNYLIFKGGTAIRKVFYPSTWRFSEDLDFSIFPIDPQAIVDGFDPIFDILFTESGITYEGEINKPESGLSVLGRVQFTGPLNMKNSIKVDISLVEKMANKPALRDIKSEYLDIGSFTVNAYTVDEILAEKIRSMIQRSKTRDYYDVWRMLKENNFDTDLIGKLVVDKCKLNNISYSPKNIFDKTRVEGLTANWEKSLGRLVEELPDVNVVFSELKDLLRFLPPERD